MTECTLHNLLTSCQYPQVFWIYQMNDYDENVLLSKGTKQEMLEDDGSFDLIDHINDVVEYWTIREDGAMFVRLRMNDRAKELYSDDYVKRCDRFKPKDELQTDTEIAKAIVHKAIDESAIADEAYPNLRQRLHDAVDNYEPQTERSSE